MKPQQTDTIAAHIARMNAGDLAALAGSKYFETANRTLITSTKNPSVGLLLEDGKRHLMYGLGDPNFTPLLLEYDANGGVSSVTVNNSERSGHVQYRPEQKIVDAVIKAACMKPSGRGCAVAALAKAAGATDQSGNCSWGTGLISSAEKCDTSVLSSTHLAVGAIQRKWSDFVKRENVAEVKAKPKPLKL